MTPTWMVLILMRNSLFVKSALNQNASDGSTSFPLGSLVSTRVPMMPQARDCNVRQSSPCSMPVCSLCGVHVVRGRAIQW
jgi:hypothetical protein